MPELTPRQIWLAGSRPKTWPAGIVPVLVGSGCAGLANAFVWWKAILALVVGLAMQVGVNYANDYSDGIRGADDRRIGPLRITASGLAKPAAVRRAAFLSLGVGAVAGLVLALTSQPWLIAVGVACIGGAWYYTGGKRPYGYAGLGEVAVFIFFGLVATICTAYTQIGHVSSASVLSAIAVGLLAVALLITNNLRDIPSDAAASKRTLAVRLGDTGTRWLYFVCLFVPFIVLIPLGLLALWAPLTFLALPLAWTPIRLVLNGAKGPDLIPVLQATGRVQLAFGVLLAVGLAL